MRQKATTFTILQSQTSTWQSFTSSSYHVQVLVLASKCSLCLLKIRELDGRRSRPGFGSWLLISRLFVCSFFLNLLIKWGVPSNLFTVCATVQPGFIRVLFIMGSCCFLDFLVLCNEVVRNKTPPSSSVAVVFV